MKNHCVKVQAMDIVMEQPAEKKKKPARKLTYKQRQFINEYIGGKHAGNGTQTALAVYGVGKKHGTDDPENTASAIASENLSKPMIQEVVEARLKAKDLTPELVLNTLLEDVGADMREWNPAVRLKATELLGRYLRMFSDKDIGQNTESFQEVGWGSVEAKDTQGIAPQEPTVGLDSINQGQGYIDKGKK
jgi:hypothetical protein